MYITNTVYVIGICNFCHSVVIDLNFGMLYIIGVNHTMSYRGAVMAYNITFPSESGADFFAHSACENCKRPLQTI